MGKNSHSFCIVQESDDSRSLFLIDILKQGISEGSAIILAIDSDPDEFAELLKRNGFDTRQLIDRGILTILDRESIYSIAETRLEAEPLKNKWFSLVSDIKKKSGCQSVMAIGTAKVFFDTNNIEKLLDYEKKIGRSFGNIAIDAICYFDAGTFSQLGLARIIHFLDYHENVVYHGGIYLQWQPQMIVEVINRSIDAVLGQGTSMLLQRMMKVVHQLDYDSVLLSKPELFEEQLRKMFGKSADAILARIQKEVVAHLSYLSKYDHDVDLGGMNITN